MGEIIIYADVFGMEIQKKFQTDRYRHSKFLEMITIKEEKLLKLFLKRMYHPSGIEYKEFR
ncbi:MAG: hypothetical protein ACTSSC_10505 [Promethearchaeota archaeon]